MKQFALLAVFAVFTTGAFAQKKESLKIVWPEEYKWQVGSSHEDDKQQMIELIPAGEKITKWTIIGTMMSIKGVRNVPMDVATGLMFDQAKQNAIDPKLTIVEQDTTAKNHWVIFKIEAPRFKNDNNPESQLYYIIQGESSLYSNFVAVKEKSLSKEFVDKWTKVFKSSELVYE